MAQKILKRRKRSPCRTIPFPIFVYILAAGNLLGAFASLLAGLADRFGRANLVVYGLLVVGLITLFWVPNVTNALQFGLSFGVVSFVEGIILVATPALIRDFAPQVGRATAMGFWTIGPVLGSLTVSAVNTLTLPIYQTWQSQFVICGVVGMVVFMLAFLFLRELAPALRDQLMVSERDRVLVELKAKGLDIEASLRHPWRQMMHVDVIASAFGVSVMLLAYYTAVGFRAHLPGDHFPFQRYAGERTRELDLGRECDRIDRGGSSLGPTQGAQTLHVGWRHRRCRHALDLAAAGRAASIIRNAGRNLLRSDGIHGFCLRDLDGELHRDG